MGTMILTKGTDRVILNRETVLQWYYNKREDLLEYCSDTCRPPPGTKLRKRNHSFQTLIPKPFLAVKESNKYGSSILGVGRLKPPAVEYLAGAVFFSYHVNNCCTSHPPSMAAGSAFRQVKNLASGSVAYRFATNSILDKWVD